jgi:hypothetical protein
VYHIYLKTQKYRISSLEPLTFLLVPGSPAAMSSAPTILHNAKEVKKKKKTLYVYRIERKLKEQEARIKNLLDELEKAKLDNDRLSDFNKKLLTIAQIPTPSEHIHIQKIRRESNMMFEISL